MKKNENFTSKITFLTFKKLTLVELKYNTIFQDKISQFNTVVFYLTDLIIKKSAITLIF